MTLTPLLSKTWPSGITTTSCTKDSRQRRTIQQELLTNPNTHLSPVHQVLRKADLFLPQNHTFETIYPYPDLPWVEPRWEIENVGCKREDATKRVQEQIEEEKAQRACVMFTDGSFIPEVGGGAAAVTEGRVAKHAYGPIEGISNYEMETMALLIVIVQFSILISESPDRFTSLAIFSDSQAALNLLANPIQPQSLQYLARFLRKSYKRIPANFPMRLYWTPGHEGVE